ncbi:prenyltransferase and squalene oxidase repeat-containing protein [Toxoplasma gondii GAB2-2007-GAL-DOM2]|uniref:Protein farnesyltransferase subunit beta n=7 Tax=Toxoplasma gondii TaxID=5811 RepID=V4ZSG3_TOXGV|nr:prenyltransferase and squalene oxidase repeat-containing protein [Toxoplasma gondii VEG]KFG27938.1 prenyltransferase and squalene oxidase repeat-containing protein [Toxoplasma gondii p89]KFG29608.1 prenyltransferase and squalene oxidase repeat-containing protein [Toxoplasma gondii GAB2-2007-GAL-DOM2]KFG32680.1 prenyltransferase and squalene oxidase repeat-containing protein [Toxoplasma gondii FOU]KFH01545.1 prenyltransferase and squalene oxidase repeat-containing protein [Toxoplasma gondii M
MAASEGTPSPFRVEQEQGGSLESSTLQKREPVDAAFSLLPRSSFILSSSPIETGQILFLDYALPLSSCLFTETQVDQQETEHACLKCYNHFFGGVYPSIDTPCRGSSALPSRLSQPTSRQRRAEWPDSSEASSDAEDTNDAQPPLNPCLSQGFRGTKQRSDMVGSASAKLRTSAHIAFAQRYLEKPFGNGMMELDASRCWLVYWMVHALDLMDAFDPSQHRERILSFLRAAWDRQAGGGWGGGPGQQAHLAPTYAATASVFVTRGVVEWFHTMRESLKTAKSEKASKAAGSSDEGGERKRDCEACKGYMETEQDQSGDQAEVRDENKDPRQYIYDWLMRVKSHGGGFRMHVDGEIDMRGTYCAVATASMLHMLTDELVEGVPEYVAACQTYEGGIAGEPGLEAHGGYTYCGLAALCILGKAHEFLDLDRLLHWAVMRQMGFEGGFQGRTNKLVDSCYSFWMSALFPLLAHAFHLAGHRIPRELWASSRHLQQYILACCQDPRGGLRDKPGKAADLYHTCYALSGLSVAQHTLLSATSSASSSTSVLAGEQPKVFTSGLEGCLVARTDIFYNVRIDRVTAARNELQHSLPPFVECRSACRGFEGPGVVSYYTGSPLVGSFCTAEPRFAENYVFAGGLMH